jgi:peptidyl-prolyl cis-trans isomerase D
MFDFFRANIRWLMGFFLILLVLAFVAPQGYESFMSNAGAGVATVDGHRITQAEWDAEHRQRSERIRQQDPRVDAALLDTPEARKASLDSLIQQRVLASTVQSQHLEVSDERLRAYSLRDPGVAQLRTPDGKLDAAQLAIRGMTPEVFIERLRQDLQRRQVVAPVIAPAAAASSSQAANLVFDALLQQREVQWQQFMPQAYVGQVTVTDADVEAFYKLPANQKKWQRPETANIEYLVLDLQALKGEVKVAEADVRADYERQAKRFSTDEERQTRHILIKVAEKASADDERAARAKAEAVLAEVRKAPQRFADVARAKSEDEGSAVNGGDLGFNGRGAFVKPFEEAAYALKEGAISDLVRSEFGFHIIQLTGVRGGGVKAFEEVRAELEDEQRTAQARKRFALLSEEFKELVFAKGDSLKPAAEKFGLAIQQATVGRTAPAGASGVLASSKLLDALFAPDALRSGQNIEALEVSSTQLVSARVVKHVPASAAPLAEVSAIVRQQLVQERAAASAKKAGEARLAASGDEGLSAPQWVSRAQTVGLPRPVMDVLLRAKVGKAPVTVGKDAGETGYWVVRVLRTDKPKADLVDPATAARQYAQAWGNAEGEAYLEALKQSKRVKLKPAAAAVAASAASS